MPDGWNDKVSSVEDFHGCDVNLFKDNGWQGGSTGHKNYGDDQNGGGSHLNPFTWGRHVSSFKIS